MRGHDIRRSVLAVAKYARNAYTFNTELRKNLGAKTGTDMMKKVGDYEFSHPLKLLAAAKVDTLILQKILRYF